MSHKFVDFTSKIKQDIGHKASLFLRLASEEIVKESEPNTPKKTGDMRRRIVKRVLGNKATIKWGTNYAIYQETKQFRNYTTPGTGPHFAENAVKSIIGRFGELAKKSGLI